MKGNERLRVPLACPACRGPLDTVDEGDLRCPPCAATYPVIEGVASFVPQSELSATQRWYEKEASLGRVDAGTVGYTSDRFHRTMKRTFALLLDGAQEGGALLDVGCGHGDFSRRWLSTYAVHGVDFALSMARLAAAHGLYAAHADARALPYPDGVFDVTLSAEVSQYFSQVNDLLGEMARVTRPGGIILFSAPNRQSLARRFNRSVVMKLSPPPDIGGQLPILHDWDAVVTAAERLSLRIEKVALTHFPTNVIRLAARPTPLDRRLASNFVVRFTKMAEEGKPHA